MSLIAGASRFLAQSTLTNKIGGAAQTNDVLSQTFGTVGILDVGRSGALSNGIGLSANARALNNQALDKSNSTYNTLFSSTAASSSVDNAKIQIMGMRAKMSDSQLSESVKGQSVDKEV